MRFSLQLEVIRNNSKNSLPINYQYELSSFVYHTLAQADEQYTSWLHENGFTVDKKQFRLFSFSSFEIPNYKIEADRIIIDCDKIKWYISFLPEKSTEHFIQGLFNNIEFSIGDSKSKVNFRVSSVEMTNTELAYEILNFQTLSPVCITRHDPLQRQVIYENPDSEYASEALFLNLKNKYKAYFGHEFEGESTFEFKLLSKPQSKLITIKTNTPEQSRVKGFKFKFSLKADPQLMQIMYHCGLGEKNAMGFGFVEKLAATNLTGFQNLSGLKAHNHAENEKLEYGQFYHIYNCGINACNLFKDEDNYRYFLDLYDKHISLIADTYAWVLMPNHFHFMVRIKDEEVVREIINNISTSKQTGSENLSALEQETEVETEKPPHQYFSNLFNAYSKAFNIRNHRQGALFERPFKRKLIKDKHYLKNVLLYIHNNPVHHGFTNSAMDYPWSSYLSCVSIKPTKLKRENVIGWFDNEANFKSYHDKKLNIVGIEQWLEL